MKKIKRPSIKTKRIVKFTTLAAVASTLVGFSVWAFVRPKEHNYFVVSTTSSFSTTNYIKENSGNQVYSSVVEGLVAPSPNGVESDKSDSLNTIIGTKKLSIAGSKYSASNNTFDNFEKSPTSIYKISDMPQFTYGMADEVLFSSDNDATDSLGQIWRFHIRNAKWANGDRVSAEDFVQTIKYAVNLKNGSTLIRTFRDAIPLKGVAELIAEQQKYYDDNGFYRSSLSDYHNYANVFGPNGGIWAASDPKDDKSSFYAYPTAISKSSTYLYYQMEDGQQSTDLYQQLGNSLFLPTDKHFVDQIGGIDKFGLSKDTLLSNGPFTIESYDPDYQVVFNRSNTYWDKERVVSPRWTYRVIPDISASIQLFKEGELSDVRVPDTYLKSFQESPNLSRFLTHGGTASSTTFIKWNLTEKSAKHPDVGPENPEVVNDPYFRRAVSYAVNRKDVINIKGLGDSTPAGDIFSSRLTKFYDENNNALEDYLYRMDYKEPTTGANGQVVSKTKAVPMVQFNPKVSRDFSKHSYINGITVDKYQDTNEAKWNINKFIERHPEYKNKKIPLKLMFDTSDQFTALTIKQQIEKVLGDKVELTIKPVPTSVFDLKTSQNKGYDFAITYQSPDYQTDAWTFLRMLAAHPDPNLDVTSTINVTGGWAFLDGYNWIKQNEPNRLKDIFENGWDDSFPAEWKALKNKDNTSSTEGILKMIAKSPSASTFGRLLSTDYKLTNSQKMEFYARLEKLIRDQAPVIPLYHASALWFARRIIGATALAGFPVQYKYAYNANDVPDSKFSLPGIEAIAKTD